METHSPYVYILAMLTTQYTSLCHNLFAVALCHFGVCCRCTPGLNMTFLPFILSDQFLLDIIGTSRVAKISVILYPKHNWQLAIGKMAKWQKCAS